MLATAGGSVGLGKLTYVFAFMVKYIAPLLILGVDIVGLVDKIFAESKFDLAGLIVEIIGLSLVAV